MIRREGVLAGACRAFGARAVGTALAFLVGVVIARRLGPDGAGVYFLALTLATIASVVGRLGLDQLLVRRVAAAREEADLDRMASIGRDGLVLAALGSIVTALLLYASAPALEAYAFRIDGLARALRLAALGVAPLSIVFASAELLRGLGRTGVSQLVVTALPPACTLGFLCLALLITGGSPRAAVAAWSAGAATAGVLGALAWRRSAPRAASGGPPLSVAGEVPARLLGLARETLPFLGVAVLALSLPWISTLALAVRGDEAEIGVFAIAYRTATLTSFVLIAVNAAAAPRFAALVARGDKAALARTARLTVLATAGGALPLVLVAWIAPGWVLSLFGAEFGEHGRVLAILATGQLVNVLTGSVGSLLLMSGNERALRGNLVGATLLSLALHVWLVPSRGPEGAAIASAAALAVLNVASVVSVRRLLAIDVLPLPFLPAPAQRGTHG